MALPIKPTPILKGRDAQLFQRKIQANEGTSAKEAAKDEALRIRRVYNAVMKNHGDKFS